jgi:hypothetical protein
MLGRGSAAPLARFRCPDCRGRTLRLAKPLPTCPRCHRCGQLLERQPLLPPGQAAALAFAAAALLLASVPDLLQGIASLAVRSPLSSKLLQNFEPPPDPNRQPLKLLQHGLLQRLAEADARWTPRVEYLADGGTRYFYRRRPGEPSLNLDQIRELIDQPPSYEKEREALLELLHTLQGAGVQLEIGRPRKPAAAAEWDGSSRTLRIDPSVAAHGTVDFARMLNHEAIHVAQSCRGGGLRAAPRLLNIDNQLSPELANQLNQPTYAEASPAERALEAEAYANQNRLGLGESLVSRYCPLRG